MNNTLRDGLMVLEHLAASAEECSVKELAERFKLPNSHACRLLKSLLDSGYVQQTPGSRKYRITLKVLCLANARLLKLSLRQQARPHLAKLVETLQRPAYLSAPLDGWSIMIDTISPANYPGDAGLVVGARHHVNRSACGKICAAYLAPELLDAFLAQVDWTAYTPRTVTSPEAFKLELERIKSEGVSTMAEETCSGLGAVAAPIFGADGGFVGAVGVMMPEGGQWTAETWERFKTETRRTAKSISFALGRPLDQ